MAIRQVRLFVPPAHPFDQANWAETLLALVVKPLVDERMEWFWFTRYTTTLDGDCGDCEITWLPPQFLINGVHRSVRFRYSLPDDHVEGYEAASSELVGRHGCWFSDWREYGAEGELGGSRFCGQNGHTKSSSQRMRLVAHALCALSRLTLDCLVPDGEGRYSSERNTDRENPHGSTFESLHHLFCNMTAVPTTVLVCTDGTQHLIRTHWGGPLPAGFQLVTELPVVY